MFERKIPPLEVDSLWYKDAVIYQLHVNLNRSWMTSRCFWRRQR